MAKQFFFVKAEKMNRNNYFTAIINTGLEWSDVIDFLSLTQYIEAVISGIVRKTECLYKTSDLKQVK